MSLLEIEVLWLYLRYGGLDDNTNLMKYLDILVTHGWEQKLYFVMSSNKLNLSLLVNSTFPKKVMLRGGQWTSTSHSITLRYKAVGLVEGGKSQIVVAKNLEMNYAQVKCWWQHWQAHKKGINLENKTWSWKEKVSA